MAMYVAISSGSSSVGHSFAASRSACSIAFSLRSSSCAVCTSSLAMDCSVTKAKRPTSTLWPSTVPVTPLPGVSETLPTTG